MVQSFGASSPARAKWRFAASSRPRWCSRHASARSARASCASADGSSLVAPHLVRRQRALAFVHPGADQVEVRARRLAVEGGEGVGAELVVVRPHDAARARRSTRAWARSPRDRARPARASLSIRLGCVGRAASIQGRASSAERSSATVIGTKPSRAELFVECLPDRQVDAAASPGGVGDQQRLLAAVLRERVHAGPRGRAARSPAPRARRAPRRDPPRPCRAQRRAPRRRARAAGRAPPRRPRGPRPPRPPSAARSRTGTHTASRHRPSGFSAQPVARSSAAGASQTRSPATRRVERVERTPFDQLERRARHAARS